MDFILNIQKYLYVTYVIVYMPITYSYSPKIFLCNAVETRKGHEKG